ncbi:MAG: hypothetical protein QOI61_1734 [Actinomycetota bacterium]
MSLTVDELRDVARATVALDPDARPAITEEMAAGALSFIEHPDRNVRVAALRVLSQADGADAVNGVLRGFDDSVKRVREVAAKSSVRFVEDTRVLDRLKAAVEREETGSAGPAVQILAGLYSSPYGLKSLGPITDAVRWLRDLPKYRQIALLGLIRSPSLTDEVAALLRDFVTHGSKDEAVAATRRLCGFRVAHHGELDPETRRASDRAWGDVYFWVPVPEER